MIQPTFINFLTFLAFLVIAKVGMTWLASKYPETELGKAIAIIA